jgi:hypothetical protein
MGAFPPRGLYPGAGVEVKLHFHGARVMRDIFVKLT